MIQICLVGYGAIAESHAKALSTIEDVQLSWLVGRRQEPTDKFSSQFGFAHQTIELNEALSDDGVDAVVITSPNALHASQALAALDAGKHVLLEIPIALSLEDAEQVAQRARQVERKLMICHSMRFFPAFAHLRRLAQAGQFHLHQFQGNLFVKRRTNITAAGNPRSWIDNVLWHHAAHFIDLAMFLGDCFEVSRLSYHVGPDYQQQGTMDMAFTMTLANGVVATVSHSYFASAFQQNIIAIGHEQSYAWRNSTLFDFENQIVVPQSSIWDMLDQDKEFIAAIHENREPAVTAEDILPTMQAISRAQVIADRETPNPPERKWLKS